MSELSCPICGYRLAGTEGGACESCPLHGGCNLVCCPRCGHTTLDPDKSRAARGLRRMLRNGQPSLVSGSAVSLHDLPVGARARVCSFSENLPTRRREALTAYGLCPGQRVCVLRARPVTVIEIDQLELALEHELAEMVLVDETECPLPNSQ